jgi:hypothetical protein
MRRWSGDARAGLLAQSGASLVEFTLVVPALLLLVLCAIQASLAFHAKSNLNYAAFQAARAGSMEHGSPDAMFSALARALVPYFGGGTNTAELARTLASVRADIAGGSARIEILSPTSKSFDDYHSPELAARFGRGARVIPNTNLLNLRCPKDRPDCPADPVTNSSGQSLQDANLLALRVTYGIPLGKQVPLAGRLYTNALKLLGVGRDDGFIEALLAQGRIPIVARAVVRMSSEPIEGAAVRISNGSFGGPGGGPPRSSGGDGAGPIGPGTGAAPDPPSRGQERPPGCRAGDRRCDPNCGTRLCCVTPTFPT